MLEAFDDRQQRVLKTLLKANLAVDEVAERIGLTRPAARSHLAELGRLGYVEQAELVASGGRPSQTYRLSRKGHDLFPKQYSWFSEVLMDSLKKQMGNQGLKDLMRQLGKDVASQASSSVKGAKLAERVQETAALMNDLAYEAKAAFTGKERPGEPPRIEATNCVYHRLATQFPEVCEFDLSLLSSLTGAEVVHEQCIIKGGGSCRFRFTEK